MPGCRRDGNNGWSTQRNNRVNQEGFATIAIRMEAAMLRHHDLGPCAQPGQKAIQVRRVLMAMQNINVTFFDKRTDSVYQVEIKSRLAGNSVNGYALILQHHSHRTNMAIYTQY